MKTPNPLSIFNKNPWFIGHNIFVGLADQFPYCLEAAMKLKGIHGFLIRGENCSSKIRKNSIIISMHRRRYHTICVFNQHCCCSAIQIPEIISKIRIFPGNKRIKTKGCIKPERHLTKAKIADGVHAIFFNEFSRPYHIAYAFRHLGFFHIPIAMDMKFFIQRKPHGQNHGGPVDGMWF